MWKRSSARTGSTRRKVNRRLVAAIRLIFKQPPTINDRRQLGSLSKTLGRCLASSSFSPITGSDQAQETEKAGQAACHDSPT